MGYPHKRRRKKAKVEGGKLTSVQNKRIAEYQNIALVRNEETGDTFWRHRYYISHGNSTHFPTLKDYPREDFKNMRLFEKFIRELPYEDGQVLSSGAYRAEKPKYPKKSYENTENN